MSKCVVAQSCPTLCDPWTVAFQAPLSMELSRQEDWSGLPCPSPGDFPDPGIKPRSPALQKDSLLSESLGKPSLGWTRDVTSRNLEFKWPPDPSSHTPAPGEGPFLILLASKKESDSLQNLDWTLSINNLHSTILDPRLHVHYLPEFHVRN